jgi:hypothetical protein
VSAEQIAKQAIRRLLRPRPLASWAAARAKAGTYEDDEVTRFRVARRIGREPDGLILRNHILSLLIPLLGHEEFAVTDLGGATGDLGADVLERHPRARYTVVENATMAELMAGRSAVTFTPTIPEHCDIFITGATLQYLDDPMAALERGFRSAKSLAALVRNSFADREIFHVQKSWLFHNGAGPIPPGYANRKISYPHRSLVEADVHALALDCGLHCIASLEEYSGALFGQYGRQLVFARPDVATHARAD